MLSLEIIMASYLQHYGGIIWTNHALERLTQRQFPQDMALQTFRLPDKQFPGKQQGSFEYQKHFGPSLVTVIATQNERHEWVILSCWIDPPLPGTMDSKKKDEYKKYQKASTWGKFWMTFKKQLLFLLTGRN